MSSGRGRWWTAVAVATVIVLGAPLRVRCLEEVEESTESLANSLLELSVAIREQETERAARHFAPTVLAVPFPRTAGKEQHELKWILSHTWSLADEAHTMTRADVQRSLGSFLAHLSSVEDVRFKVKRSTMADDGGGVATADIGLWLVGRDARGRREWIRGRASASARRDAEGRWQLTRFVLERLESVVATRDLFDEVAEEAGLAATAPAFLERTDPRFAAYGVAVADVDDDGLLDLYVTGADRCSLYLNQGDGTFRDGAAEALVDTLPGTATAPLFLDYDNDGDRDLFVSTIGSQVLLENRLVPDGELVFWDVSHTAGIARSAIGFSAVAGDVNRDGFPDIYVASYNRYGEVLPDHWDGAGNGTPNLLFLSRGDGTFSEEAAARGVADARWSYAAQLADIDGDGDLDLYVANDFGGGNALYLNRGDRFVDVARERGVLDRGYGMGVSFGDYDNDGDLDLHVTRMSSTAGRRILARLSEAEPGQRQELANLAAGNALYENTGHGSFREVSQSAGPFSGGWAWGGGFFDLDNDGWQDLYTPNGFISGTSMKDT